MNKFTLSPDEFRAIREQADLSYSQLGAILGITDRSTIRQFESGHRPIPTPTAICMVFIDLRLLPNRLTEWQLMRQVFEPAEENA